MKKQITTIVLGMLLIGIVGAMSAGETYEHDFGSPILNCSILNNSYDLEGLELNWGGSIATISTVINYKPDNFVLSCWINQSNEVVVAHHHSSKKVINQNITIPSNITIPNNTPQQDNISSVSTNFSTPAEETNITTEIPKRISKDDRNILFWIISIIGLTILLSILTYFLLNRKDKKRIEEIKSN